MSLESRLAKLERERGTEATHRYEWSHRQLLAIARHALQHDREVLPIERWEELVGAPEELLELGEPSHAELVAACVRRSRVGDLAPAATRGAEG